MSQTSKPRRKRSRNRRAAKVQARIAAVQTRVDVEKGQCSQTGKPFCIGKVDGVVVYTSKVLRGENHYATYRANWIRRMSRRLVSQE